MKISYLLFTSVLILLAIVQSRAQIILAPGEEKTFTNQPATGGEDGDNGNVCYSYGHTYDINTKVIKAETNPQLCGVGKGEAYASIYYDFQISETPQTDNNSIGAWISYNVLWHGYQVLAGIASLSYCNGKIEVTLTDKTTDQTLKNDVIHDHQLHQYSYDFLAGGFDLDSDEMPNNYAVVLRRGHVYRLSLTLTTTVAWTTASICDYMNGFAGGGDGRVDLTNLFVKIGLDEEETLQKLAKLDSLENRIDTLEYKLEHHYHVYLTGRGAGQNNTEANTTLSIFEAGGNTEITDVLFDLPENNIPDKNTEKQSIPDDFSLEQNYPNPFNPSTKISFAIPTQEQVTIKVFDILGRQVEVLMNDIKTPGYYSIDYNAAGLPSGTYFYEIRAGNFIETKKMILLK